MSEEFRALAVAAVTGPFAILVDRIVSGVLRRRKDNAETGLTIDQRWEQYADKLEDRMKELEGRVDALEGDLRREQARAKGLEAEVDRYRSIARSLLRHVLKLREALGKTEAEVPDMPQDVENALTSLDLP